MAKVIMTKRDNCGDYQEEITCKIVGKEEFARKMCENSWKRWDPRIVR